VGRTSERVALACDVERSTITVPKTTQQEIQTAYGVDTYDLKRTTRTKEGSISQTNKTESSREYFSSPLPLCISWAHQVNAIFQTCQYLRRRNAKAIKRSSEAKAAKAFNGVTFLSDVPKQIRNRGEHNLGLL
jgi:hypothetical protein